ncbi:MAG: leucine-rich repeat domain-containing protein [Eubacterium sp.]|nr:leucine-rich repeat domain-containing protein [Eubacterium sp.]
MKKIISMILSLALLLSVNIPSVKGETEKEVYLYDSEVDGNEVNYSFKEGILTVSGTGLADQSYTSLCSKKEIKKVVIKSGIRGIADKAFYGCTNMTNVKMPKSVSEIGHYAFYNTRLTSVTIPKSVECIGAASFCTRTKLKKVTMPGHYNYIWKRGDEDEGTINRVFNNGVKEIHFNSTFKNDQNSLFLADKIYTAKDDMKYKSYNGIVYTRDGKKLVLVPYTTKKLNIRKGCKTIYISAFAYTYHGQGEEIPYLEDMKKMTIPSSVTKIVNDMKVDYNPGEFNSCKFVVNSKKLTGTSIENLMNFITKKTAKQWLTAKRFGIRKKKDLYLSSDNVLLKYAGKKTSVKLPNNLKRIGQKAFAGKNIKTVKIPKNVTSIGNYAFYQCKKLTKITWNKKIKKVGDFAFAQTKLKELKLPKTVKHWGSHCFADCSFKKVKFAETMKKIPEEMFEGVTIENLVIPGNIKTIGRCAFEGGKFNTIVMKEGVRKISIGAFDECDEIQSMELPKSLDVIEDYAFRDSKIGTVTFKNPDVKIAEGCFYEVGKFICKTTPNKYFGYADFRSLDAEGTLELYVFKVEGASGLEIQYLGKSFKVDNKTGNVTIKTGVVNNGGVPLDYNIKIRPYTRMNGTTVLGQWHNVG